MIFVQERTKTLDAIIMHAAVVDVLDFRRLFETVNALLGKLEHAEEDHVDER